MSSKLKSWALSQSLNHSLRTVIIALILTLTIGSGARYLFLDDNVMNMLPKDVESRRIWDEISSEFKSPDILFIAFGKGGENVRALEEELGGVKLRISSFQEMPSDVVVAEERGFQIHDHMGGDDRSWDNSKKARRRKRKR